MMKTEEEIRKDLEHNRVLRVSVGYYRSHPASLKEHDALLRWGVAGRSPYECAKVAFDPITGNELDYLSGLRKLISGDHTFLNSEFSKEEAYELLMWKPELADRLHLWAFEEDMWKLQKMEW